MRTGCEQRVSLHYILHAAQLLGLVWKVTCKDASADMRTACEKRVSLHYITGAWMEGYVQLLNEIRSRKTSQSDHKSKKKR
jgi:hypothetical protein